jgi:hypothetical protein
MKALLKYMHCMTAVIAVLGLAAQSDAASLSLEGTQPNVPTQFNTAFFPGGSLPYQRVQWRTDNVNNAFATSHTAPNRWYGKEGYALFATTFTYPDADQASGNAFVPIAGNATFQNVIDLPSWVTSTEIIADRLAGGFAYALIDDPRYITGVREGTFDGTNYPPYNGSNGTGQDPWLKIGSIRGTLAGRNDPNGNPDRWSFTVGNDIPDHFRIGVMTDGLNANSEAPTSVHIRQSGDDVATFTSQTLPAGNRRVDMTFFDIVGAQAGDTFIISAGPSPGRVDGFSFDVIPEPASATLLAMALAGLAVFSKRRVR